MSLHPLDAVLAAQKAAARHVPSPTTAADHAARAHAAADAGSADAAIHEFGLALRLARAAAAAAAAAPAGPAAAAAAQPATITAATPIPDPASPPPRALEAVLAACRAGSFARLAARLRSIPAAQSEARALFGLDPLHLADLALRDAGRAAALAPDWPPAAVARGLALHQLERYGEAEAAFLDALELDPACGAAADGLRSVAAAAGGPTPGRLPSPSAAGGGVGAAGKRRPPGPAPPATPAAPAAAAAAAAADPSSSTSSLGPPPPPLDDAECVICSRLLFEPVTTPCGHSFCRRCLARAADHAAGPAASTRCPMCRAVMHVAGGEAPVSVVLAALLERAYPAETAARAAEEAAAAASSPAAAGEAAAGGGAKGGTPPAAGGGGPQAGAPPGAGGGAGPAAGPAAPAPTSAPTPALPAGADLGGGPPVPLFVMATLLPGEHMALNIFEPRYRLLVRRVMAGSRRFGMAALAPSPRGDGRPSHALHPVATEVEILECQPQPDGRFYLEVVGRRRFRIGEAWEVDGYRVAVPRYFADSPPASPEAAASTAALAAQVEGLAEAWVDRVRAAAAARGDGRVLDLLARAGAKPPPGDAEALSFWVANLVPAGGDRAPLAAETDTASRLARQLEDLRRLGTPGAAGCCVM